jgi:hypothetical protein
MLGNAIMGDLCMNPPEDGPKHGKKYKVDIT